MRLTLAVHGPRPSGSSVVTVDADPATPVGVLARDLAHRSGLATGTPLYRGLRRLEPDSPLARSGLHDGAPVGVGRATPDDRVPDGLVELRLVGGEGAGTVVVLPPGEYEMGSDRGCRIRLSPAAPARTGRVSVTDGGSVLLCPRVPVRLAERDLDAGGEEPWIEGEQLAVADTLMEIAPTVRSRAELVSQEEDGGLRFNRPPRLVPPRPTLRFRLPRKPGEPPRQPLSLLAVVLVPLVGSIVMVAITGNWRLIFLGLLSPLGALLMRSTGRRRQMADFQDKVTEFEQRTARLDRDIEEALLTEQRSFRLAHPDPGTLLSAATGPSSRLWERRFRDTDFLELRVGTGSIRSSVEVEDPEEDDHRRTEHRLVHAVPAAVPLREVGVVGVADTEVARFLVAEAALLHSPEDLRIVVLTGLRDGTSGEALWGWTRWLPHLAGRGSRSTTATGTSAETTAARVAELTAELSARQALDRGVERGGATGFPDILLVLDGARRLRALPGVVALLRDGPEVGLHVLCLDDDDRLLPEECRAVVQVERELLRMRVEGRAEIVGLRPDRPVGEWYDTVARGVAALRPVGDTEESTIPKAVRLLDVLDLEPPTADAVAAGWITSGRSTRARLGVGVDGDFRVDLVQDGPHALVAGTTGAGKSELLQTLVASFAVANRPDEMTFVLVDYKGGSAFAECADLPHTVGMVTDLDTHLVERALVSLGAELRRREHLLADAGAKDIADYLDKRRRAPALGPLPRLVLVVDEFASMIRELPDFVSGLVNIAQRGRSLGIHLVLATQRPSGSVTPDIRANTNLRIALRTTDASESRDIIDAPDAGDLSPATPGRAYARLSASALLPFQVGRIGGRRPGVADVGAAREGTETLNVVRLEELSWTELSEPVREAARGGRQDEVQAVTDLAVLATAVAAAAERSGIPRQPSPWLPPLPGTVTLESLRKPEAARAQPGAMTPVAWGIVDLPAQQARAELVLDLDAVGHLHLAGAARSGRSQALRTLAAALADAHSVADLHLYGIDCGNGALLALTELPHCGAVVDHRSQERLGRLLDRLTALVTRRQEQLGQQGVADLAELRAATPAGERPPHIVVVVDRFEVFDRDFANYDNGSYVDRIQALLRDGGSVGVHLVLTGDRVLGSGRYAGTTEDKLVLRLNDDGDYQMLGLRTRDIPATLPPGRALRPRDVNEVQIAVLDTGAPEPDLAGAAQARALAARGRRLSDRELAVPEQRRPFRLLALPSRVEYVDAAKAAPQRTSPLWALVGVGGDELVGLGPDLADTPTFVVAGPPRSGRSTALLTVARSLLEGGTGVLVVAPRRSPLRELEGRSGVAGVLIDPEVGLAEFRALLGRVVEPTGAVLVDDAELALQTEIASDLALLARGGAGEGWALVAGGNAEALSNAVGGWAAQARRNRVGLLINPQSMTDGEVVGVRLRRGLVGGPPQPGRAHLHLGDGTLRAVQVPFTQLE